LTVRIAYNLFTQKPKEELTDFKNWTGSVTLHQGDDYLRHNGAGEMLVFSAADFEDFLEPRPDLPQTMEQELEPVVRHLVEQRWPFRLHATYNESISRMLDVFEKVNRDIPFNGLPWFFDHAETITPQNIERVRALGGGIAIQDRMAFQGEYFVDRYGAKAAEATPPIKRMLAEGVPVGAGTDATRVSSYNPWTSLYWMVSGRTVGGLALYEEGLPRTTALELFTHGSAWFSSEQGKKGQIKVGQLADLAALSADFFHVDEEAIKWIESVLTVVGGKIVYAAGDFEDLGPARCRCCRTGRRWSRCRGTGARIRLCRRRCISASVPARCTRTAMKKRDCRTHRSVTSPVSGARSAVPVSRSDHYKKAPATRSAPHATTIHRGVSHERSLQASEQR
jgi:predicted amidohydrolase YtcJ